MGNPCFAGEREQQRGSSTRLMDRIISTINDKVLSKESQGEAKAFFVKMVGDYYRYIAENAKGALMEEVKQAALKAYTEANQINLPACNPIKLGLALNFSVFHYEVMKNHKAACDLADKALQDALDKIDERTVLVRGEGKKAALVTSGAYTGEHAR